MSDENELIQRFENLGKAVAAQLEKLGEITQVDHQKNVGKLWRPCIFPICDRTIKD